MMLTRAVLNTEHKEIGVQLFHAAPKVAARGVQPWCVREGIGCLVDIVRDLGSTLEMTSK